MRGDIAVRSQLFVPCPSEREIVETAPNLFTGTVLASGHPMVSKYKDEFGDDLVYLWIDVEVLVKYHLDPVRDPPDGDVVRILIVEACGENCEARVAKGSHEFPTGVRVMFPALHPTDAALLGDARSAIVRVFERAEGRVDFVSSRDCGGGGVVHENGRKRIRCLVFRR